MMKFGKILAVDDDLTNIEIIKEILNDEYALDTANNGQEALDIVSNSCPDLILLDIMMEGIDGYEVCERIRAMKDIIQPKIILLSGKIRLNERLEGYEHGADDYLTKPYNDDELMAKVRVYLHIVETEKQLREMTTHLEQLVTARTNQLIDSEKMASIGQNVAEIVHNLKNPLTILKAATQNLLKEFPEDKYAQKVKNSSEKLEKIVLTILTSKTGSTGKDKIYDFNEAVMAEIEIAKTLPYAPKNLIIETDLVPVQPLQGSPIHCSQVFSNLLSNAVAALTKSENPVVKVYSSIEDGTLVVCVADNGTGISEDHLDSIFEPFYTSKPLEGKEDEPIGTGLGLPSVKRMIEAYHGSLGLTSKLGEGTTFTLKLPLPKV